MNEVTMAVSERMYSNGLEKGSIKDELEVGDLIAYNKNEDDPEMGLLFGRIKKQTGRNFEVEPCIKGSRCCQPQPLFHLLKLK